MAVSKTKSVEEIKKVYDLGHRDFGENRAQELAVKAPQLPDDIRWHFVGGLQTNKVRLIRDTTTLLHSMDRESLAKAWVKGKGRPPATLVQVNVGEESQKHGVEPDSLVSLLSRFTELEVPVVGLMAIPPIPVSPEESRPYFNEMFRLRERLEGSYRGLSVISMGMTDDFEVAIEEGTSLIRVGRAIFGPRN